MCSFALFTFIANRLQELHHLDRCGSCRIINYLVEDFQPELQFAVLGEKLCEFIALFTQVPALYVADQRFNFRDFLGLEYN